MIGEWTLANVSEDDFLMCLGELTESGHDQAILFIQYPSTVLHTNGHIMYFLVCTDPDGKWYWLNDPEDTGWTKVKRNSISDLPLIGRTITLVVAR